MPRSPAACPPAASRVPAARWANGPTRRARADYGGFAERLDHGGPFGDRGVAQQAAGTDPGAARHGGAALELGARPDLGAGLQRDVRCRSRCSAGSTIVTPARIHESSSRSFSTRRAQASCVWSLTPSTSSGIPARGRSPPGNRRRAGCRPTSVRYSSPLALSVGTRLTASASRSPSKAYMPELISSMARCSGLASASSTIAGELRRRHPGRSGRNRSGSLRRAVSAVTAAPWAGAPGPARCSVSPAQQRGVGVGHDHGAVDQADGLDHRTDCVAGAALPVLDDDLSVRTHARARWAATCPRRRPDHDDEPPGLKLPGRGHDMVEHRAAAHRVQHLRGAGLHPRALARRKDDDGGRTVSAHSARLLGIAAGNRRDSPAGSRSRPRQDTARPPQPWLAWRHLPRNALLAGTVVAGPAASINCRRMSLRSPAARDQPPRPEPPYQPRSRR